MRHAIKLENGDGWSVRGREVRGIRKTQVTYRYQDGLGMKNPRSAVFLPYEWTVRNQRNITTAVADLKRLLEERNLKSLKEAESFRLGRDEHDQSEGIQGWEALTNAFIESRGNRRESTLRDLRTRMRRVLETMNKTPKPRNWESLLTQYSKQHFGDCPEGGQGRKRQIIDVIAFLKFAVTKSLPADRWMPPSADSKEMKDLKKLLVGKSQAQTSTVPLKGQDLENLLQALEKNKKHSLYMVVALIGLFGLRPSELAVLEVKDSKLYVGHVKNNENTIGEARPKAERVIALDLPSLPNEGQRMVALYESGKLRFPLSVSNAIKKANEIGEFKGVGDAVRQLLQRFWYWQQLEKQIDGLKVYSLRHSFAFRAHKESDKPLSVRDAAALMRHDPRTHLKHYGRWVDEAGLEEAAERFKAGQEVGV